MVSNDVTIVRGKWYWISMRHVPSGQNTQINIYDPANNYTLVGTAGGAVTNPTGAATVLQFGIIKYSSGASQSAEHAVAEPPVEDLVGHGCSGELG
jgi:hypothetical protein